MTTPPPASAEPTKYGPEEYSDHVLASRVWNGTEYYYPHLTSLKERCRTLLAQRDAALSDAATLRERLAVVVRERDIYKAECDASRRDIADDTQGSYAAWVAAMAATDALPSLPSPGGKAVDDAGK